MAEQYLTIEEAASRLHVHPVTVRRHLKSGLLRGRKQGKLWRVPESALTEAPLVQPAVSPLVRGMALILERDAQAGPVPIRTDGSTVTDLREIREAQTP